MGIMIRLTACPMFICKRVSMANTESKYPKKCNVRVTAILLFKMVFIEIGVLCNIQIFLPSKEIEEADGEPKQSMDTTTSGAYSTRSTFMFGTPVYSPNFSGDTINKRIPKTQSNTVPNPVFRTAI